MLALGAPAAQAAIGINDVQVSETNGTVDATFTISRSAGLFAGAVTVQYATVAESARAPGDYADASGAIAFPSALLGGNQVRQVTVAVQGDRLDELTETFKVAIGGPEVTDGEGVGTITDDDPMPTISVKDAPNTSEGGTATFAIALSTPSGRDIAVAFATANGTATSPQDYTARGGSLVLPAGAASVNLGVPLIDDAILEPDERFELRISSPVAATLGDASGVATIVDNDAPPPPPPPPPPAAVPPPPPAGVTPPPPPSGITPIGPPDTGGGTTKTPTATGNAPVAVSKPRLKRPSTVIVTVSCPRESGRCKGTATIFTRPNKKSKIKALRKQRRLVRKTFSIPGGGVDTLRVVLSKTDQKLLLRAGRFQVRAFVVSKNSAGRTSTRTVNGSLIGRTTHS